jgi:protein-disulfide isomerase/uncharacterized membrane protein
MQVKKWAGAAAVLLIVAGLGISLYLFTRGNKLAAGEAGSDFCNALFEQSCDGTLTSEYSHVLGLSLGGWGVVYFGGLGALVLGGMCLRSVFLRPALAAALLCNLAGLAVSGFLASLFISGKVPLCPLCIATHTVNLALLVALLLYRGESPTGFLRDVGRGLAYLFAPGHPSTPENTTRTVTFIAVALLALVLYLGLALQSMPAGPLLAAAPATGATSPVTGADQVVRNIIQAYMDQDVIEVPIGPNDPRLGPADAPVQLVIFSDFECPSCKAQSRMLERLVQMYGDRISIVAKHYPLSSVCNRAIAANPHQNACGAAYASVAAHMQGKFWPFHDLVYHLKGTPSPDALSQVARATGLDLARFLNDMSSDAAKAKITEDVELGIKLKIIQTPTTYLNGRLLTSDTGAQLPLLIQSILESAMKSPIK